MQEVRIAIVQGLDDIHQSFKETDLYPIVYLLDDPNAVEFLEELTQFFETP